MGMNDISLFKEGLRPTKGRKMSLTQTAERAALYKLIDYVDEDPEGRIPKIMDTIDTYTPSSVFPTQRAAFRNAIDSRSNWYELILKAFRLNPEVRRRLLKALIVDANILAWPVQEKAREKYQCNIPWAILLDPTSACNLRCTGCWAAEYGHALNLSYEDICSIIDQGRELGVHIYIYTGGEPLVRKDDLIRSTPTAPSSASPTPPSSTRPSART